jgi:hypothetical protein
MRVFIFIVGTFLSVSGLSQDYDLPTIGKYDPEKYFWEENTIEYQKEYWPNGSEKLMYENLENGKKLRQEYYPNGNRKIKVEVTQVYANDTTYFWDERNYAEIIQIRKGIIDVLSGEYYEYDIDGNEITKGGYHKNNKFGRWETIYSREDSLPVRKIATYNEEGELDGEYIEYYPFFQNKIKIRGEYKPMDVFRCQLKLHSSIDKPRKIRIERRVGDWIYYDLDGEVIEVVKYTLLRTE